MPPPSAVRCLRAASRRTAAAVPRASQPPLLHFSRQQQPAVPFFAARARARALHTTSPALSRANAPRTNDRGPPSSEETQTDFDKLDVFAGMPVPTTAIDATFDDGFAMNSGLDVARAGVLLVAGDAFKWRPWIGDSSEGKAEAGTLRNERGMWECDRGAWGALDVVWPKPDLLIVGTGATMVPISPTTRKHINDLGIRLEVSDTRNAAAQFNLLATERGVQQVAAALVPIGWVPGKW